MALSRSRSSVAASKSSIAAPTWKGRRAVVFRWRNPSDDKRDAEHAEIERLREEGKRVVEIGWDDPDGDDTKTIEHQAGPEPSDKK
jgi:hypothetical protein